MRRISTYTTLGALIATFAGQPMTATAATAHHTHHRAAHPQTGKRGHAATHKRKKGRVRPHLESRYLRQLVASHASCLTTVDPTSLRLLTLRSGLDGKKRSQSTTARMLKVGIRHEQLLEQIALLELRGQTGGVCSAQSTSSTLGPATRLTATAPWLKRSAV
jgi:hypothetical protein